MELEKIERGEGGERERERERRGRGGEREGRGKGEAGEEKEKQKEKGGWIAKVQEELIAKVKGGKIYLVNIQNLLYGLSKGSNFRCPLD